MASWTKILIALVAFLVLIQFIPVTRDNPPFEREKELQAPQEISAILKRSCYDCHSNETRYSTYSYIAPLSWGVRSHIKNGRNAMNFSTWNDIDPKIKKMRLERLPQVVKLGFMPMGSYLLFHPYAELSEEEKRVLADWANNELKSLAP